MTLARSFAKNAFFKGIGEVAIRLFSFAFIVLVARAIGDDRFGILNFAFSFTLLFVVVVDFGLNPLLVRDVARDLSSTAQVFYNLLIIKLGLAGLFVAAILIGLAVVKPEPAMVTITYWMAGFVMLNSFTEFTNAIFNAHQKMQYEALTMALQKLGLLLFGLLALWLGWGVLGVAAAYVLAGVVGVVVGVSVAWQGGYLRGPWKLDKTFMRYAMQQALPLTLTTWFVNLYFRIDMTLLAKLRTSAEVGWYSAAHKCIEVLMIVPAILVVASFPGFSKLFTEDRDKLARMALKVLRLLLMLGMPMAGGAVFLGTPLLVMLFGEEYIPAGSAFVWLTVALGFIFLNYALSYLLISGQKQRVNATVSGLAVGVSLGANLLIIPHYGHVGAAISAAVTELFLFIAYYYSVQRWLFAVPLLKPVLRIGLATGGMMLCLGSLRMLHPVLSVAVGGLVYVVCIWLLRVIEPEDMDMLRRVLKRS